MIFKFLDKLYSHFLFKKNHFIKKNNLMKKTFGFVNATYIDRCLKKKDKKFLLVFDCKCSPATYGDFASFIILIRLFQLYNKKIELVIINGEYWKNWARFRENHIPKFLSELRQLSIGLSLNSKLIVHMLSWSQFNKKFSEDKNQILFEKKVLGRKPIYDILFNSFQFLYFLNKKNFEKIIFQCKKKDYVTINVRFSDHSEIYSNDVDRERDTSLNEIIKILTKIKNIQNDKKIIIITDQPGFKKFKEIKKKFSNVFFSKEFASTFLEDVKIILNSEMYIQYNTGGMGTFPILSNLPYYIGWKFGNISWAFFWKNSIQYTSWQTIDQKAFYKIDFDNFLNKIKLKSSR